MFIGQQQFEPEDFKQFDFTLSTFGKIKVGDYCMLKGNPCLVKYIYRGKGESEMQVEGAEVFTERKYKVTVSPMETAFIPTVTEQQYEVVDIDQNRLVRLVPYQEGRFMEYDQSDESDQREVISRELPTKGVLGDLSKMWDQFERERPLYEDYGYSLTILLVTVRRALGKEQFVSARNLNI